MPGELDLEAGLHVSIGQLTEASKNGTLAALVEHAKYAQSKVPKIVPFANTAVTDGSGNLTFNVVSGVEGYRLNLHRLLLDYSGSDPVATASVEVRVYRNAVDPMNQVAIGASLPIVFEWSNPQVAPVFQGNDAIAIFLEDAPISTRVYACGQYTLTPDY